MDKAPTAAVYRFAGFRLDIGRGLLITATGEERPLRRQSFEMLRLFTENAGRLLTRDVLIDRIWGSDYFGDTKTLDVHIKRIRSKIEVDPSQPTLLLTVRGLGYRFEA